MNGNTRKVLSDGEKNPDYQEVRFFHCGEYGHEFKRPHYHALIFGIDFPDRKLWTVRNDIPLDTSDILSRIWGNGFCTVGQVTWTSAAYVARYTLKKKVGKHAKIPDEKTGLLPYERIDPYTGKIQEVSPEYSTQSNRPGIGAGYFDRYGSDCYPLDEVIVNGHPVRPPRYYDKLFEIDSPEVMEEIRERRVESMQRHSKDNTRARLRDREKVKEAQLTKLTRGLSNVT